MLLVDTLEQKIEEDDEFKLRIANSRQHKRLTHNRIYLDQMKRDDVVYLFLNKFKKIFTIWASVFKINEIFCQTIL